MIERLDRISSTVPMPLLYAAGVLSVGLAGLLDRYTGADVGSFVFYLLCILVFTYAGGITLGVTLSIVSAAIWFLLDVPYRGDLPSAYTIWNALIRLATFLISSYTIWEIHRYRRLQAELMRYIVHDLRTPLTGALLSLENLEENEVEPLSASQLKRVKAAYGAAKKLSLLVEALMDLSHMERGKFKMIKAEVEVQTVLQEAIEHVSTLAEGRDISFNLTLSPSTKTCLADKLQIVRVIANILGNGIRISPRSTVIDVAVSESKRSTLFCIQNSGPGLTPKELRAIFGKSGLPPRSIGSGFGLRFCKLAVEAHGGTIWAESEAGRGVKICFTLPRKKMKQSAKPK